MNQNVKTTIRWIDDEGNVVGAYRETEINLPSWGKALFLRNEIDDFLKTLLKRRNATDLTKANLTSVIMKALQTDSIIQIKSTTKGSRISLRDKALDNYLEKHMNGVTL